MKERLEELIKDYMRYYALTHDGAMERIIIDLKDDLDKLREG